MADFVIYQTDERMFLLREELKGFLPSRRTHFFAPNVLLTAKVITDVAEGEIIVGGKADSEALALFNSMDITYYNLLEDENFQAVNARLTAEGALHALIGHSLISVCASSVLVIGFGRTGAAVSRLLRQVGVKSLTVASNSSQRQAWAVADKVIKSSDFNLSEYDAVINTVPEKLISDKAVLTFKPTAVYVDLASTPALSLCFAKYVGIDADVYPALPAKTAPRSAAAAIADYVKGVAL